MAGWEEEVSALSTLQQKNQGSREHLPDVTMDSLRQGHHGG